MRLAALVLVSVLSAAPLVASAADAPATASVLVRGPAVASLRHVEYAVTTQVDGRSTRSRLLLDLVGTTADRGVQLEIAQPDQGEPVRVDVDKRGVATVANDVTLTREAALLVYFFALGAQNMTGLDPGDEWGGADGTRFRVVRKPAEGRLDIAFTRVVDGLGERADYRGRLVYDAFKVVPLSFDARGDVRDGDVVAVPARQIRVALTLTKDSQP
jgi:hypothetical protein